MTEEFVAFFLRKLSGAIDDLAFLVEERLGMHEPRIPKDKEVLSHIEDHRAMAQDIQTATENSLMKARIQEHEQLLPSALDRLNPEPEKKTRKPNTALPKDKAQAAFVEVWNTTLYKKFNTPKVLRWSKGREDKLRKALKANPDLAGLLDAVNPLDFKPKSITFDFAMVPENLSHLLGEDPFVVEGPPDTVTEILEADIEREPETEPEF